jgi:heterodisulfide reductase subunit C
MRHKKAFSEIIPHCWNCGSNAYWNDIKDCYECSVCGATTCPHSDIEPSYSWIAEPRKYFCLNIWCNRRMEHV